MRINSIRWLSPQYHRDSGTNFIDVRRKITENSFSKLYWKAAVSSAQTTDLLAETGWIISSYHQIAITSRLGKHPCSPIRFCKAIATD